MSLYQQYKNALINESYPLAFLDLDQFNKNIQLNIERAGIFYEVHKERPFYGELVEYMSSGPIVAAILEKENAVANFRALIGATDPTEADEGTVRKLFAESKSRNAVHGSDSDENAQIESDFHFSSSELF